jgi:hypothetical protein
MVSRPYFRRDGCNSVSSSSNAVRRADAVLARPTPSGLSQLPRSRRAPWRDVQVRQQEMVQETGLSSSCNLQLP